MSKLKYSLYKVATVHKEQSLHKTVTLRKEESVQGFQQNIQLYERTVG
jgi:hypothetical protein